MSNFLSNLLSSPLCAVFGDTLNTPFSLTDLQSKNDLNSRSETLQTPVGICKQIYIAMKCCIQLVFCHDLFASSGPAPSAGHHPTVEALLKL